MTTMWTTSQRPRGWPVHGFQSRMLAIFLGITTTIAVWIYQPKYEWTAIERHYLTPYMLVSAGWFEKYAVLHRVDAKGKSHPATPDEIEPVEITNPPRGTVPFQLTKAAMKAGAVKVAKPVMTVDREKFKNFLRDWIYHGQTLTDLAKPGMVDGLGVAVVLFVLAWPRDRRAKEILVHGRRVRGAELVSRDQFNRRRKYRGWLGFLTNQKCSLYERFIKYPNGPAIMIPPEDLAKHFLLMGDTGTGKSALIRQMLWQLHESGQTAIVYDPAREYVERFYNPERGDVILNPLDARSPYWNPGEELTHDAEARTIAESVFPDQPKETPFFIQTPRKLFAEMLLRGMDAEEMVRTMSDSAALDKLVEGTELASMISHSAPSQREGVRASLNLVADALRLLKTKEETATKWSAREWSEHRRGWIFLTSTPELRAPLQPLLSLWLDILVLRLMNTEEVAGRPVWFVLDELASLQKLPQLATALTENRKSNNPVVIGMQGKAQMETLYGHLAEAMLSQPWTKIFLKTSEARAAKWISDAIGEQDREWLRESRTSGAFFTSPANRETKTYAVEKRTIPLILPAEVSGLPALHGFLKNGNDVVLMSFPYLDLPKVQEGFVRREERKSAPTAPPRPVVKPETGKTHKLEEQQQHERGAVRTFFD